MDIDLDRWRRGLVAEPNRELPRHTGLGGSMGADPLTRAAPRHHWLALSNPLARGRNP
jgi:hypothetical protein